MEQDYRNPGMYVLNEAPPGETVTLVVAGLPRSGTSMVAASLLNLGVFMGRRTGKVVFEDAHLSGLIERGEWARVDKLISETNAAQAVWGWKRPEAWQHFEKVLPRLRNPRVIFTFRDILAIAMRNHVSVQTDLAHMLKRHAGEYVALVDCVRRLEVPTLLISYEKGLLSPDAMVDRISSFAGLLPDPEARAAAISVIEPEPEIYRTRARLDYIGAVDGLDGRVLTGWAAVRGRPAQRVYLVLTIDDRPVAEVCADRPHAPEEGMPGEVSDFGFSFTLPRFTRKGARIEVLVRNSTMRLAGSGLLYRTDATETGT